MNEQNSPQNAGIRASWEVQDSTSVVVELADSIRGVVSFHDRCRIIYNWLTRHGFVWRDTAAQFSDHMRISLEDLSGKLTAAQTALAASQAQNKALREALNSYAHHREDCDWHGNANVCTCGLTAALTEPKGES